MSREYHCSECGKKVEGDLLLYIQHTEEHIVDEIRKKNPDWVESDGFCKKCEDFYRDQIKGS